MSLDFVAGCFGGAAGVIVGHPLDTVKVRLQIQSSENAKYRGTFHCLSTTVKNEGVRGLYKGITSPLVGVAGVNALIFGVYGSLRPYVHGAPGHDALWAHFVAGGVSGGVQSFIASPMELVKTRMQLNEGAANPPKALEVLRSIYRREGGLFRGVFKGYGVTVCREVPGFGSYFASYELLTRTNGKEIGTLGMLMAGGMAGVISWIVTFPTDVVKTRLQSDVEGKYRGALDCIRKTYKAEGMPAFWRGLGSTVLRAFPTNAATFTVVTWIMRWAESLNSQSIPSGAEYVTEILKEESSRLQETLRLPLPHYFIQGQQRMVNGFDLGHKCAGLTSQYWNNTQSYFNFYETVAAQQHQCQILAPKEGAGSILRDKFGPAIEADRQHQHQHQREERLRQMCFVVTNMTMTGDKGQATPVKLETVPNSNESRSRAAKVDEGSDDDVDVNKARTTPPELENANNGGNERTRSRIKGFLQQMFSPSLACHLRQFNIRLCSCWEDNCVCLN